MPVCISRKAVAVALEAIVREAIPGDQFSDSVLPEDPVSAFESANLNSIDLLTVAGKVNTFFGIHETGLEDNLLRFRDGASWVDLAHRAATRPNATIAFETSGTTGAPRRSPAPVSLLLQEVEELKRHIGEVGRVVSTVSARHIYGFLFTALLPEALGVDRVDVTAKSLSFWRSELREHDLLIAFPDYLSYLADLSIRFPERLTVVTSTAPTVESQWDGIARIGAQRMLEVYGSTETGGIGIRNRWGDPFSLFSYYDRAPEAGFDDMSEADERQLIRMLPDGSRKTVWLPDRVVWYGDRQLTPGGRTDGAVQVGGVNVYPRRIEEKLLSISGLLSADIRPGSDGSRLEATFVLTLDADEREVRDSVDRLLEANERPRPITFRREKGS